MCKRGVRGAVFLSPHSFKIQQLYGLGNALFKHIVCNVPFVDANRGKGIGALMRRSIVMVVGFVLDGRGTTGSINGVGIGRSSMTRLT